MKIEKRTELLFSQAVALQQNGKMKSNIFAKGNEIFILNMDSTILLKCDSIQTFSQEISFSVNDYEGTEIQLDDDKIVFITCSGGFRKRKICKRPLGTLGTFVDIKAIWEKHIPSLENKMEFSSGIFTFLDDGLSHIEFSKKSGQEVSIVQQDIYSGSRIEIKKDGGSNSFLDDFTTDESFEAFGMRTNDFQALFAFSEKIVFYTQLKGNWIYVEADNFDGIVSKCVYDELGKLGE